jgi:crotonobetainyl-CoA:carnitine CoA-transferase CaiB-like acyl-CoA transferase
MTDAPRFVEPDRPTAPGTSSPELAPYRVLDLSTSLGGAYCARLLAGAGADVLLVEGPEGNPLRHRWCTPEPLGSDADGAMFQYLRHGQRAVLYSSGEALLEGADIVITDAVGPLGSAEAIAAAHPHAVVVALSPWGLHGPYSGRPASELTIQAESGGLAIRGRVGRPPFQMGGQITDLVMGVYAAVATLAALRSARHTGKGELIDMSWLEVSNLTATNFSDLFDAIRGRPDLSATPGARSLETPSIEPTLDGYVGFNTNTRQQFEDFCVLIDRVDLLAEGDWASLATRAAKWEEWNAIVHEFTTKHTTAEIVEQAALLRIPCAPVSDAPTVLALDHAIARGVFGPDPTGTFTVPRRPWQIDGEAAPALLAAPLLGEHDGHIEPHTSVASAAPADSSADVALPLAGVRVVDLTAWWAGPSAAGTLAALGADVIHVESISRPDGMRMSGGMFIGRPQWWELSAFFLQANTNKRGLTLDLAKPEGRSLVLRLIETADVVIENFTPRVLESFDLGWDVIHATNPRAILVRMPAFGLDGPWRDRPGFAQTMEQVTGLAWLTGYPDDQPRIQRGPCDPNGGMHAAFATLIALERRDRTGVGCFVEAPMFEAALNVAAELVIEWTAYGRGLERTGNRSPIYAPQGLYTGPGAERYVALSVTNDAQWRALIAVLDAQDPTGWADDRTLATAAGRMAAHDQLDERIAAWAASRDVADAVDTLVAAGVPAGVANDPRRTTFHPQLAARRFTETPEHPVTGPLPVAVLPYRFGRRDEPWIRRPAPTIGQHNVEILTELGCTLEDIAALEAAKIIGTHPTGL